MYRMVFILLLIVYIVWCSFYIFQAVRSELGSQSAFRSKHKFSNNIGNKDYSNILSFPPMDAVFTWVNGSDPEWIKEKNYYEKLYNEEHNITNESQIRMEFYNGQTLVKSLIFDGRQSSMSIDVADLPEDIYYLVIIKNGEAVQREKIVIER